MLLVRTVLAHGGIRLVYRPHPYTGRRIPAVAAAHRQVVRLLRAANAAAGIGGEAHLRASVRPAGTEPPLSAAGAESAALAGGEERLRALPPSAHAVVEPDALPLGSCFNVADGLLTDVSSVLSDFLPSEKPMGVCTPPGCPREHVVDRFPTAAAADVLAPVEEDVYRMLAVLTGERPDGLSARRAAVRERALGPADPPALARFGGAVSALSARAHLSASEVPETIPTIT